MSPQARRQVRSRLRSSAAAGRQSERSCSQVWAALLQNANWMERCTLLCSMVVLLSGLFYRTSYLEVVGFDGSEADGQTHSDEVATGGTERQVVAVDVVCLLVAVTSALYMIGMSVIPVVRSLKRRSH